MTRSIDGPVPGSGSGADTAPAGGVPPMVGQMAPARLVALFLVPGVLLTIAYVVLAPVAGSLGLPPLAALLAGIALVLVPFELGVVLRAGRGDGHAVRSVLPYREPLPLRSWSWLVPALIAVAFAGSGLGIVVDPAIQDTLFGWLPGWFVNPLPVGRVGDYSSEAWIGTLVAYFVLNGVVGPIVEELYFRGYLLPRMQYLGRRAWLVNVGLFSLYHFWSPWQLLSRIVGFGPTVYAVQRRRNIYLGMAVHCTLNILGVVTVAALVVDRL